MKTFTKTELTELASEVMRGTELDKETTLNLLHYALLLRNTRDEDLQRVQRGMREAATAMADQCEKAADTAAKDGAYRAAFENECKAEGLREFAAFGRPA